MIQITAQIKGPMNKVRFKTLIKNGKILTACSDGRIAKATYEKLKENKEIFDLEFIDGAIRYRRKETDEEIKDKMLEEIEQMKKQASRYAQVTYEVRGV